MLPDELDYQCDNGVKNAQQKKKKKSTGEARCFCAAYAAKHV